MPRQILFIQGAGEGVHDGWDNRLVESLTAGLGEGYAVSYPRMPNEGNPLYPDWKEALFEQFEGLEEDAILIGHSIGGAFAIHAVAQYRPKRKWGAVVLIAAPFLGEGGWAADETDPVTDLAAEIGADIPVFLYHGTADEEVPPGHMALYGQAIAHARTRALAGRDHQINDDLSEIAGNIRDVFGSR